jgi:hypothetical protein
MAKRKAKVTAAEVRGYLEHYFEEKAVFQSSLAREKPWSAGKNGSYGESLSRLAAYVASLPDNDPTLKALASCPHLYDEDAKMFRLPQGDLERSRRFYDDHAVHCGPRGGVIDEADIPAWFTDWSKGLMAGAERLVEEEERYWAWQSLTELSQNLVFRGKSKEKGDEEVLEQRWREVAKRLREFGVQEARIDHLLRRRDPALVREVIQELVLQQACHSMPEPRIAVFSLPCLVGDTNSAHFLK